MLALCRPPAQTPDSSYPRAFSALRNLRAAGISTSVNTQINALTRDELSNSSNSSNSSPLKRRR